MGQVANKILQISTGYQIKEIPEWVKHVSVDIEPCKDKISGGIEYLLIEEQVLIEASDIKRFTKSVRSIANETGLENASHYRYRFNPSYENILLHELYIIRNGQKINLLHEHNIRLLDDEYELHKDMLNHSKAIHILIEDLRVGDIIVASETREGFNPAFGNKYCSISDLNYGLPVKRLFRHFRWNKERNIQFKLINTSLEPISKAQELIIDEGNVTPVYCEAYVPDWYSPYGYLQLSESTSWEEVIEWGCSHFSIPEKPSASVKKIANDIAEAHPEKKDQITAALRFVQNQIRYTALSIGEASHKPYSPELVLERRFGDCKDKSLFMVTLLHLLGIKSAVALVNTYKKHEINDYLPSANIFNHAIVAVFWEERIYWFDPTRNDQEGDVYHNSQSLYGTALVLDRQFKKLIPCQTYPHTEPNQEVFETYEPLGEDSLSIILTLKTIYRSFSADQQRARFAEQSLEEIQKSYVNFMTKDFANITMMAPLEMEDDKINNEICIIEKYFINNPWKINDHSTYEEKIIELPSFEIRPQTIHSAVSSRKDILSIDFPNYVKKYTNIKLPRRIPLKPSNHTVENEHIQFHSEIQCIDANEITWTQSFKTLKDFVEVDLVPDYLECLKEIYSHCYLSVPQFYNKVDSSLSSYVTYAIHEKEESCLLTEHNRYEGSAFPARQDWIKNTSIEELTQASLNSKQAHYPEVTPIQSITKQEHENILEVTEQYRLSKFWKREGNSKTLTSEKITDLTLENIIRCLIVNEEENSEEVNYLAHLNYSSEVTINLPDDDWVIPDNEEKIVNEFLAYRCNSKFDKNSKQWLISQKFYLLRHEILPTEVSEFNQALEQVYSKIGWHLTKDKSSSSTKHSYWLWIISGIFILKLLAKLIGF